MSRAKIVSYVPTIIAKQGSGIPLAIRFALEDVLRESDSKTPSDTTLLRRNTLIRVNGRQGSVTWGQNYAAYQEDKQYQNYTTPGTGPHFAENAVKKIVKDFKQYLRKANV